ncbi:hypothetical protein GEMRC1_013747 [Eukaryota sp. GEM-RC1]
MDGDVESNPGPVTQQALDCLQPDHLVDDEVLVEFSRSIFQTYFKPQASSVDFDDLFIQPALLKGYNLFPDLLLDVFINDKVNVTKEKGYNYLIIPLNDSMTEPANDGTHWGLVIVDCVRLEGIFIDPKCDSDSSIESEKACFPPMSPASSAPS